jgi:cytidylate kinase
MAQAPAITIDGPSGTGKSTIAQMIADKIGFTYLDSGSLYRALAWHVIDKKIDITNLDALQRGIAPVKVALGQDGSVHCDGQDISEAIRVEDIGMMASKISAIPLIRKHLLELQRDQRRSPGLVTDGRDMGTVVFPDAEIKIYLTASAEERAKRRFNQLKEKGIDGNLREIEKELNIRDQQDSERSISPLKPADDAIIIDTSSLEMHQVFDEVLKEVRSRLHLAGV